MCSYFQDLHAWRLRDAVPVKSHRLVKSHVFSPDFSATCHLWLMLGSERENQDSIDFMHEFSCLLLVLVVSCLLLVLCCFLFVVVSWRGVLLLPFHGV